MDSHPLFFVRVIRCGGLRWAGQYFGMINGHETLYRGFGRTPKEAAENALLCFGSNKKKDGEEYIGV